MSVTTNFNESIDSFKVIFGGKSAIDAEFFIATINNTIELVKASANAINPDCFVRLEIRANKEGSFETIIDCLAREARNIFTKENFNLACSVTSGVVNFFKIKRHLRGEKYKEITPETNDLIRITNQDNDTEVFPKEISHAYFSNSKIENCIINIYDGLRENERTNICIKGKETEMNVEQKDFDIMAQRATEKGASLTQKTSTQIMKNCELIIKKADLLGNSKWDFILDKRINAKIEDDDFLCKIKDGILKISGGYSLICDLEIKTEMTESYEVSNVEYVIKKVHSVMPNQKQLEII